ncbi:thioredoxin-related protein [Lutibacter sp. Hel_I_33_5]|uniref:thioredoxin family protein n=1 Tax=Lutibacter sp. Hel_I_33_5 TaxID=1566289 RepID=UPI0011A3D044|nr:thioredoxin fold domain-containing protein [Lutibacter sp. Hel_I_33_5]TVZ57162.1 thioredoxin-related protein [Lutibacter sp. Hel_I_33_5]
MKRVLFLILVIGITFSGFSQDDVVAEEIHLNWKDSFKDALKASKKEKKPVLIYFTGSDWCGPCKMLDKRLFHTQKFKDLADENFIIYEADNPRNKDLVTPEKLDVNFDLIRKYKVRSYPTLVFTNHKGKMIAYKKGLILTEYYYPFFQSVIENY